MKFYLQLIRPEQWVKNLFVFMPLFFGEALFDGILLVKTIIASFACCLVASSIYCLNDIKDIEADRLHPVKRKRALAAGKVTIKNAYFLSFFLFVSSLGFTVLLGKIWCIILVLLYFVLNVLYTYRLKNIPIVEFFIISMCFLIRIFIGGITAEVFISHWIVLMTFLLSLFLAIAKRRNEYILFISEKNNIRKCLNSYSIDFLNYVLILISTITVVCYIMYTVSTDVVERFHNDYIYLTTCFVLAGIIRYLQIIFVENFSGSPTKIILKDRFIQLCVLAWGISFFVIIYI